MPKLRCPCGFVHDLSSIPDKGWITIRDEDYERLIEAEVELSQPKLQEAELQPPIEERRNQLERTVTELQGLLYCCPECGRIMWQPEGSTQFRIYALAP